MIQTIQTERAIDELLLATILETRDFPALLQAYRVPLNTHALMLLENQPQHPITQEERQDLLHFAFFDPTFNFMPYTAGRVFHTLGELRWERQQAEIHLVYTGHKEYKPALRDAQHITLDAYTAEDRAYILFGKRLNEKQLARIGPVAQTGDFAEVRIPRLLRYPPVPALTGVERVQLVMREYIDPETALTFAYRFKGLVPFQ